MLKNSYDIYKLYFFQRLLAATMKDFNIIVIPAER